MIRPLSVTFVVPRLVAGDVVAMIARDGAEELDRVVGRGEVEDGEVDVGAVDVGEVGVGEVGVDGGAVGPEDAAAGDPGTATITDVAGDDDPPKLASPP